MEKRIGSLLILIEDSQSISKINEILSSHSQFILGRQGIPLRDKEISVISIVLEGTTDEFGSISGKLGRLNGVQVKSIMAKS
ncbi:MAG: iron-only hydrogenase system regulator [Bacteroidales bacterium]|nr:iron-only hydrogenase system regulator [Bacteroidales bacterium]